MQTNLKKIADSDLIFSRKIAIQGLSADEITKKKISKKKWGKFSLGSKKDGKIRLAIFILSLKIVSIWQNASRYVLSRLS